MAVVLEIQNGPGSGKRLVLRSGQTGQVGSHETADLMVRGDEWINDLHFALDWVGESCRLRDLDSRFGTLLNGRKVREATVQNGDQILAGQTTFLVWVTEEASRADQEAAQAVPQPESASDRSFQPQPPPGPLVRRLLQVLRGQPEPLFALLDAARDPRILELLRDSQEEYQSLYEGWQGELLTPFAPHLVKVLPGSPFLEILLTEGWGKSWGIYLTCAKPFREVRKHFRQFLLVKTEDGRELYFRFYDPRVLRVFLPTCTPQETGQLFGPVSRYLMEGEQPETLISFAYDGRNAERNVLTLAASP